MYQQTFGQINQVSFKNENEFYELLGFLANSNNPIKIVWEHNEEQGAWGSEGRLHFYTENYPFAASLLFTAGVGKIRSRVNCNEFVQNIVENHAFIYGRIQHVEEIKATIPRDFFVDFERGFKL